MLKVLKSTIHLNNWLISFKFYFEFQMSINLKKKTIHFLQKFHGINKRNFNLHSQVNSTPQKIQHPKLTVSAREQLTSNSTQNIIFMNYRNLSISKMDSQQFNALLSSQFIKKNCYADLLHSTYLWHLNIFNITINRIEGCSVLTFA